VRVPRQRAVWPVDSLIEKYLTMEVPTDLQGCPQDYGWQPHKPDTWTHRYAKLRAPLKMSHFTGWVRGAETWREVDLEAGHAVKIVMVSRFGDVGITENLTAETGYGARVCLCDLYDYTKEPA